MTLAPQRLTFALFQATGRDCADLRTECPDYFSDMDKPVPGRVYANEDGSQLFIESNPEGGYTAEVGTQWTSGPLTRCEKELYGFYVMEVADDDVRAYLIDTAPECAFLRGTTREGICAKDADTEESLCDLYKAWIAFEGLGDLNLGSASDHTADDRLTAEQQAWLYAFGNRWDAAMEKQA